MIKEFSGLEHKRFRRSVPLWIATFLCLALLANTAFADDWVGGIPLTTVQNGTVSGDLWFDATPAPNWGDNIVTKTFTLPEAAVAEPERITWARLYISAYCGHMQSNYTFSIINSWDGDNDGIYEQVWSEPGQAAFQYLFDENRNELGNDNTALGGGAHDPYKKINDHENRVTSDYFMWYNVTDMIENQTVNVNVNTTDSYDGRIKVITLVVAYNDPSSSTNTTYWVNQGHDVCSLYTEDKFEDVAVGSTTFSTSTLSDVTSATLTVDYMASHNGYYGFPTTDANFSRDNTGNFTGNFINLQLDGDPDVQGAYSGLDSWDVTSSVTGNSDATLGYSRNLSASGLSAFYKIPLAFLVVKSGEEVPESNFTADVISGNSPLTVNFTDTSTGSPSSWFWDFGDDTNSTVQNPVHTFNTAGYYTVNLTVTNDDGGVDSEVKENYITAKCNLFIKGALDPVASNVFAWENNTLQILLVMNDVGNSPETEILVNASDGWSGRATVSAMNSSGSQTISIVDPTIRETEGSVTYTYKIDPDNLVPETDETTKQQKTSYKNVKFNGYKGVQYWTGKKNISTYRTYDLQGNITYSFGNSSYRSGSFGDGWTSYMVGWTGDNLTIPEGADVVEARLYVPYCWDYEDEVGKGTAVVAFNGVNLTAEHWEEDTANFGSYDSHRYGLLTYNVTGIYLKNKENTATFYRTLNDGKLSPAGFTLAVVYKDPSETRKQIFLNEGFDLLGASTSDYATTEEEATSYTEFTNMTIDMASAKNAMLTTFVPWGSAINSEDSGEGNLIINGAQIGHNVWNYGERTVGESGSTQVAVDTRDILGNLSSNGIGNVIGIQSTNGASTCMAADLVFLVVECESSTSDKPDLIVSSITPNSKEIFANMANNISAKVENNGSAAAGPFNISFSINDFEENVTIDGLSAGETRTISVSDPTIRTYKESVEVAVTVDSEDKINESSEANNALTFTKSVVYNGYCGKRWTDGEDLKTVQMYEVKGGLLTSTGDSHYLSASSNSNWTEYTVNWTSEDIPVPFGAEVKAAHLYIPYTWDKGPVFPSNVSLSFNSKTVESSVYYTDEKMWGIAYPYGAMVYNVTSLFSSSENSAILSNTYPGGGNVSLRGMLLTVIYDDGSTSSHQIIVNEGFDLLYGGSSQATTPEQATAYAPFKASINDSVENATLITFAPGAGGPAEGDLLFNNETFADAWNYVGTTQVGESSVDVTNILNSTENVAAFRSNGDYMEAMAAFLVLEYKETAPIAAFTADKTSGAAPLTVKFADTSTGSPSSWYWEFGDGSNSTLQNPTYTYETPGNYTVNLTVTNDKGTDNETKVDYITVREPVPPTANFSANRYNGTCPLIVQFTDLSQDAEEWSWDFENDGIIDSSEENPKFIYETPGNYTVNLTVGNIDGTDNCTAEIVVKEFNSEEENYSVSLGKEVEDINDTTKEIVINSSSSVNITDNNTTIKLSNGKLNISIHTDGVKEEEGKLKGNYTSATIETESETLDLGGNLSTVITSFNATLSENLSILLNGNASITTYVVPGTPDNDTENAFQSAGEDFAEDLKTAYSLVINMSGLDGVTIKDAYISMTVPKAYVESYEETNDFVVMSLHEGKVTVLESSITKSGDYYIFTAYSPDGFSVKTLVSYTPKTETESSHKSGGGGSGKTLKIIPAETPTSSGTESETSIEQESETEKIEITPVSENEKKSQPAGEAGNENGTESEGTIPGFEAPLAVLGIFLVLIVKRKN